MSLEDEKINIEDSLNNKQKEPEKKEEDPNKIATDDNKQNNNNCNKPIKKKAELIVISNDDCNFRTKEGSLQSSFKNFHQYLKSMKNQKKNTNMNRKTFRDDPQFKNELREKFFNSAVSCLGIPYGKKYLKKHPEYDGIFLDCCGLVRYAFNLLKEDFGFHLSYWNQAYQFDILPDEIPFSEMKKGDLIFYSGIYYPDRNMKLQPHNMTHVEIYCGEGEKTIGSRNSDGVVEYFDTFQFASEGYYNIEYHFKSIDTWLRGIHKSFCEEHKWHEQKLEKVDITKNKYSIFYQNAEEEIDNNDNNNDKNEENKIDKKEDNTAEAKEIKTEEEKEAKSDIKKEDNKDLNYEEKTEVKQEELKEVKNI